MTPIVGFAPDLDPTTPGVLVECHNIVPDEYDPHALLRACDDFGEQLAEVRVPPGFKLSMSSASAWIEEGFRRPR